MKEEIMPEYLNSKDVKQLMAEADDLIGRIDAETIKNVKKEHRLQFEIHAQHLKIVKSKIQNEMEMKRISTKDHGVTGMHEAVQEISKAMGELNKYLKQQDRSP